MQNSNPSRLPLPILLLPILVFLGYLAANASFFVQDYQELGDYAANALQIWKAAKFQETLGAYSRFLVNHPGPVVFYYLAWTEKVLFFVKSPQGAHEISIVFYNLAFVILSLRLLFQRTQDKKSPILLFASLILGISPLLPGILSNIWGPGVILFPTLLFLLSVTDFSRGSLSNFFWMTVTANLIVQNQIVGISFVFPMLALSGFFFFRKGGLSELKSKASWSILSFSLLFTLACWLPPLIEQFSNSPGNITKILTLAFKNSTFHKLAPSLQYTLSYYVSPLAFLKDLPPFLIVSVLFAIPLLGRDRLTEFEKQLFHVLIWAFFLTLFGAFKMKGGQISHVYWFTYILASILYYLSARILTANLSLPENKTFIIYSSACLFLCFAFYGKNQEFKYDDRPEKFLEAVHPTQGEKYRVLWKSDPKDFKQGDLAMGLILRLVRNGYDACLNEEWHFLVRESFQCKDKEAATDLILETLSEESESFQIPEKGTFLYKSTRLRIVK
ncbi:hypothetical protein EHQ27_16625 [Leptospira wolffii]|nr:hypothetical protein EHQ32_05140 [Leptospira wolffii]TGK66591.1 hypothetical protein EHQ27_16625 [Leptospira wolffii]TGK74397.1 hypothetical protein EHQ35_08635 [Leptospira wolffii]TGL32028.1 hypothetical protein EHQ57_04040 [Leptospira wolffii]